MLNLLVNKTSADKEIRRILLALKKLLFSLVNLFLVSLFLVSLSTTKVELVGLDCLYLKFRQGIDHFFLYPLSVYAVYDGRGTFICIIVEVQRNTVLFVLNA